MVVHYRSKYSTEIKDKCFRNARQTPCLHDGVEKQMHPRRESFLPPFYTFRPVLPSYAANPPPRVMCIRFL